MISCTCIYNVLCFIPLPIFLPNPELVQVQAIPSWFQVERMFVHSGEAMVKLAGPWGSSGLRISTAVNASITEGYVRFTASLDKFALVSFKRLELKGSLENFFHLGTSFYVLLHDWHLPLERLGPPYVCLFIHSSYQFQHSQMSPPKQQQRQQQQQQPVPGHSISGPDHNGKCVSDSFSRWEGFHSLALSTGLCQLSSRASQLRMCCLRVNRDCVNETSTFVDQI